MLYLIMLLMITLLGFLIAKQRQQERIWQEEWKMYQALAQDEIAPTAPSDELATPFDNETQDENDDDVIILVQQTDVQAATPKQGEEISIELENETQAEIVVAEKHDDVDESASLITLEEEPRFNNEASPDKPVQAAKNGFTFELLAETTPETITLDEATRNLYRARNARYAEQPHVRIEQLDDALPDDVSTEQTPWIADEIVPNYQPKTISNEEATRLVSRPLAQILPMPVQPDVVINKLAPTEIITPTDPALARVRQNTLAELNEVRQHEHTPRNAGCLQARTQDTWQDKEITALDDEQTEPNWLDHAEITPEVQLPEPRTDLKTIEISDIQDSLQRQIKARQWASLARTPAPVATENTPVTDDLPVIPTQEVWANLANARQPIPALSRRNRPNEVPPIATKTTNNPNKNTSSISPMTVAFPTPPLPAPEIVAPVSFETQQHADAFAADFFTPNNPNTRFNKTAEMEPEPTFSAPYSDQNNDDSALSEADFAAYYAEQEQQTQHQSWANSWRNDDAGSHDDKIPLPPLNLLQPAQYNPKAVQSPEALLENSIVIEEKLAEYKVKVKVLDAYAGPVITRYEIEPNVGVRGNSVINLEKDLARSLGVAAIRVVETIPGKTCMGLELPNPKRQMIRLREILDSAEFAGSHSKLTLALGQDISGIPVITDLAKAPHLLVAGTTGSGKSVGVNSMILSMLYKATPEEVRMIMIDPKMLELSVYQDIPHLLAPVVTDMKLAANALNWCVNEMEKRYRLMSHVGVRNLAGYNQKITDAQQRGQKIPNPFSLTPNEPEPLEKLPFIVVVVDEFADLMMVAGKQIEQLIARLAQKARAAGIHLILATQRPSVDVITGLIKANIPTRIAFQVSSKIDSRTVLDQMGAENLLGQGDMLFLPPGTAYPQRIHGAFVADDEVHRVVDYWKQFGEPNYVDDILTPEQGELAFGGAGSGERDPLFDQAVDVVLRTKKASVSELQRRLRIGYNKAAILMEQLENEGIVSTADHSGKRSILAHSEN